MPNSSKMGGSLVYSLTRLTSLRLEAADEFDDLAELLFVVDPDGGVIVADVIAQDALDEIQVAVQQSGRLAVFALLLDLVPGAAEEFDVGANFVFGGAARGGAHDEAAGKVPWLRRPGGAGASARRRRRCGARRRCD